MTHGPLSAYSRKIASWSSSAPAGWPAIVTTALSRKPPRSRALLIFSTLRADTELSVALSVTRSSGCNVEREHHSHLGVLGDVAVGHPAAGVGDVEEDVDGLAGADEDGVLPDQVGLRLAVAGEDEEAARAVDVER